MMDARWWMEFHLSDLGRERRIRMKRRQILLWVFVLGLLVGLPGVGCSSKKDVSTASLLNVKDICIGCITYSDAHKGKIPNSLEDIKPYMKGGIVPESPRKPNDFDGPSYIYVEALAGKNFNEFKRPFEYVMVYENPAFCEDEISVGFLDVHVLKMTLETFRQALEDTYKKLGVPMPEGI